MTPNIFELIPHTSLFWVFLAAILVFLQQMFRWWYSNIYRDDKQQMQAQLHDLQRMTLHLRDAVMELARVTDDADEDKVRRHIYQDDERSPLNLRDDD